MGQLRSGLALTALALAVMGDAGPAAHAAASTADIVRFLEQATWGPTPELVEHVREVGFETFPRRAVRRAGVELSDAAAVSDDARHGRLSERFDVPARQLHDVPAADALLPERALRRGPAAAARRVRAAPDHRRVRRRDHPAKLDGALPPDARSPRLRQLSGSCSTRSRSIRRWATTSTSTATRARGPNENYAREVLQLFSIGTVRLNPDGTPQLRRALVRPIPTLRPGDRQQLRPRLHRLALRARAAHRRAELHRPDGGQRGRSTTSPPKTLLNGAVLPSRPEHHAGPRRRASTTSSTIPTSVRSSRSS